MVPAAYLRRRFQQRLALIVLYAAQDRLAYDRMSLDDLKFLRRQLAGLVEYLVGNVQLADIVKHGRRCNAPAIRPGEPVPVGLFRQALQQQLRQAADMAGVIAALAVAVSHDPRQHVGHHAAAALLRTRLLYQHRCEPPLAGVQLHRVHHAAAHHLHIEGALDVICHAQLIGVAHAIRRGVRRDHDDRDVVQQLPPLHLLQHLNTVHARHDHIQQHQRNVRSIFFQLCHALRAVRRLCQLKLPAQHLPQNGAVQGRIVHDEDALRRLAADHLRVPFPDHRVLPPFGAVHEPVGAVGGRRYRFTLRHDAADADRQPQLIAAAGYVGALHPLPHRLQHGGELLFLRLGHQYQKFVTAVPHQRAAAAQLPADHLRQRPERLVPHAVPVHVVVQLQVVHIHQRHAAAERLRAHVALVVVAAERAGQNVLLLLLGVPAGDHQRVVVHPVDADVVLAVRLPALPEAQAKAVVIRVRIEKAAQVFAAEIARPDILFR